MRRPAYDPANPVPCMWCGTPTPSRGTKKCDRCWELSGRIESNPRLAWRMLRHAWWCGFVDRLTRLFDRLTQHRGA